MRDSLASAIRCAALETGAAGRLLKTVLVVEPQQTSVHFRVSTVKGAGGNAQRLGQSNRVLKSMFLGAASQTGRDHLIQVFQVVHPGERKDYFAVGVRLPKTRWLFTHAAWREIADLRSQAAQKISDLQSALLRTKPGAPRKMLVDTAYAELRELERKVSSCFQTLTEKSPNFKSALGKPVLEVHFRGVLKNYLARYYQDEHARITRMPISERNR